MYLYVYRYMYMSMYMYVYMSMYMYVYVCMYMSRYMYVYVYIICLCKYVCACVCVCVYVYIYIYMPTCVYVCVYVYVSVYVCIYKYDSWCTDVAEFRVLFSNPKASKLCQIPLSIGDSCGESTRCRIRTTNLRPDRPNLWPGQGPGDAGDAGAGCFEKAADLNFAIHSYYQLIATRPTMTNFQFPAIFWREFLWQHATKLCGVVCHKIRWKRQR